MRKLSFSFVSLFLAVTLLQLALSSVNGLHTRHASVEKVEESPLPVGCHNQEPNFKAPSHCGSETQECEFTLKWKKLDTNKVEFDLVATVAGNTSVWAAVGFSGDSKMGDTDVVVCWIDDQGNTSIKQGSIFKDKYVFKLNEKEISKEKLTLLSMKLNDDELECKFSRTIAPVDGLLGKPLNTSWHVLVASGALTRTPENTLKMKQHRTKYASHCKCDVTDCNEVCSCPSSFRYQLLKLHGVIMCVTFIFLIPTGALLARYYKMAFTNTWFKGHVTMMVIGVLWSLVGLALILGHTRGKFEVGGHQLTGVTCIVLCVIQPLVALFRPPKQPTVKRVLFSAFHRTVAVSVLILSIIALFWGSFLYHNSVMPWMMAALGLTALTNLGFVLLLEILTRTHKFATAPPVGYHKVTKQDELSESEEEVFVRDDPAKKTKSGSKKNNPDSDSKLFHMEKGLLMLFVIQSFCFAILVSGLIFYYDSLLHH